MLFTEFLIYTKGLITKNRIHFESEDMNNSILKEINYVLNTEVIPQNWDDTIMEIHIGVYLPHYDYPIVPLDENDEPLVWKEDYSYIVKNCYSHRVLGCSISNEKYNLKFIDSLVYFKNCEVKVDKFTDSVRASWVLCCFIQDMIKNKNNQFYSNNNPVIIDYFQAKNTYRKDKEFEEEQKRLYMKWLSKWISIHGKNPETHMKKLKVVKTSKKMKAPVINIS